MARVNLSINGTLYEKINEEAKKKGVSVNNLVYNIIVKHFDDSGFDLLEEFANLKKEAAEMALKTEGKFSYNDLPTYQNLEEKLSKSNYPESAKQVKLRLSMMFRESNNEGKDWEITFDGRNTHVEYEPLMDEEQRKSRLLAYYEKLSQNKDQK